MHFDFPSSFILEIVSGAWYNSIPAKRKYGLKSMLDSFGKVPSYGFIIPFAGRHSHFVTPSESLQKGILQFVAVSKSSAIAQRSIKSHERINDSHIRVFNITLIQCVIQPLLPDIKCPVVRASICSCFSPSQYRLGKMDTDDPEVSFSDKLQDYEKATASSSKVLAPKTGLPRRDIDGTVSVPEEVARLNVDRGGQV